jgi:hypothetical protein
VAAHPSDSEVQRRAELVLVKAVADRLGVALEKKTLNLPGGATVQLDGCNQAERVACEAFARQGEMNPGQKRKLGNDILKLLLVERRLGGAWRKIVVVANPGARASLSGGSWQSLAVSEFGIEVLYAPLDAALSTEILAAQGLQVMTNVTNLGT